MRLLCALFLAPFPLAAAASQLLAGTWGVAPALAAICAVFALFWGLAAMLVATGRRRAAEMTALGLGLAGIALAIAAAGGAASPMALLVAAPAVESYRIAGTRRALLAGAAGGVAALASGLVLPQLSAVPLPHNGPAAAHWLVAFVYAASLGLRWPLLRGAEKDATAEPDEDCFERHMNALLLRLSRSGDVRRASAKAAALLNVPADILLASGFFDRIHVADRVAYLRAVSQVHGDARPRTLDIRLRRAAGHQAADSFRRFSVELFRADDPDTIVAVVRDEEDKAALEAQLARAREDGRAAALESERLMAAVSHELRTPLNAILGFSETLLMEIFGRFADDRQREHARLIHQAGEHLLSVVNATLEISKVGSGTYALNCEAVDFRDVAEASLALTRAQAERRSIDIALASPPDLPPLICDRRALRQILINLLSNAIKFSLPGGKVTVAAGWAGDRFRFSIADDGVGISADDLRRVGRPFMQARTEATREVEGTGLGLALVRGLVDLHGGTMTMESTPGEGTRVTVLLPTPVMWDGDNVPSPTGVRAFEPAIDPTIGPTIDNEWDDENYRKSA